MRGTRAIALRTSSRSPRGRLSTLAMIARGVVESPPRLEILDRLKHSERSRSCEFRLSDAIGRSMAHGEANARRFTGARYASRLRSALTAATLAYGCNRSTDGYDLHRPRSVVQNPARDETMRGARPSRPGTSTRWSHRSSDDAAGRWPDAAGHCCRPAGALRRRESKTDPVGPRVGVRRPALTVREPTARTGRRPNSR